MASIPQVKRCADCGNVHPITEFHRNKQQRDGYSVYCRTCANLRTRAGYRKAYDQRLAYAKTYHDQHKDDPAYIAAMRQRGQAWIRRNPDKRAATLAAWRSVHVDERRAYGQAWRRANRVLVQETVRRRYVQRIKGSIVPFTIEQLEAKLAYWGNRCWVCDGPQQEVDHVKPLARGGLHILANLRPICRSCNAHKSAKWPYP